MYIPFNAEVLPVEVYPGKILHMYTKMFIITRWIAGGKLETIEMFVNKAVVKLSVIYMLEYAAITKKQSNIPLWQKNNFILTKVAVIHSLFAYPTSIPCFPSNLY